MTAPTYAEGLPGPPGSSVFPFSRQDRADLLAYMVQELGLESQAARRPLGA